MKAFLSSIISLLLLVVAVVGSWFVWFRPKAAPIVAVRRAVAEAAKSTVEAVTDRKLVIAEDDDLPQKKSAVQEKLKRDASDSLFSTREVPEQVARERKQFEEDMKLRALVYPKAQDVVRKELAFPQMAKFSTLQPQDDQYSICRRVKASLWESRGVTDHLDAAGHKQRSSWLVLHRSLPDGTIEPLYIECGAIKKGSAEEAMKLAASEAGGK